MAYNPIRTPQNNLQRHTTRIEHVNLILIRPGTRYKPEKKFHQTSTPSEHDTIICIEIKRDPKVKNPFDLNTRRDQNRTKNNQSNSNPIRTLQNNFRSQTYLHELEKTILSEHNQIRSRQNNFRRQA